MQFRTPQFIDIEDKIFGPFTFKQFIYMLGGAAICYLSFKLLPFIIGVPIGLAVVALALALAFYKINNRPFITVLQAWVRYQMTSKLYVWHKAPPKKIDPKKPQMESAEAFIPKLSDSKLKDISWSLDVLDSSKKN